MSSWEHKTVLVTRDVGFPGPFVVDKLPQRGLIYGDRGDPQWPVIQTLWPQSKRFNVLIDPRSGTRMAKYLIPPI
jgi:hypothetical protein